MRLSEAHAKIMMRRTVNRKDAVVAISCISLSQTNAQTSLLGKHIIIVDYWAKKVYWNANVLFPFNCCFMCLQIVIDTIYR